MTSQTGEDISKVLHTDILNSEVTVEYACNRIPKHLTFLLLISFVPHRII